MKGTMCQVARRIVEISKADFGPAAAGAVGSMCMGVSSSSGLGASLRGRVGGGLLDVVAGRWSVGFTKLSSGVPRSLGLTLKAHRSAGVTLQDEGGRPDCFVVFVFERVADAPVGLDGRARSGQPSPEAVHVHLQCVVTQRLVGRTQARRED